jgi:Flp/Fap pilin component.
MNVWLYLRSHLQDFWVDHESGQGLAEYALILALIAIVAVGALGFMGQALGAELSAIGTAVENAAP